MCGKEEMSQEAVVDKIAKMGQVVAILHLCFLIFLFYDTFFMP
jgi:hypothetical protein